MAMKIADHGQTDCSAFSRLGLEKYREASSSSEAFELVRKIHVNHFEETAPSKERLAP